MMIGEDDKLLKKESLMMRLLSEYGTEL